MDGEDGTEDRQRMEFGIRYLGPRHRPGEHVVADADGDVERRPRMNTPAGPDR